MKLRIAALAVAAVSIVTATSACASGAADGAGNGSKAAITWSMWSGDNESTKKLQDQMAVAQALVPDVKIELQTAPWADYFTKLNANMASGKLACITSMNGQRLSGYTAALTPLTDEDLKVAGIARTDYSPGALSVMEYGGKLYGLPYDIATMLLFYNADLFKKAGIEPPTNTWTIDQFEAAAKTITEKTGVKGFAVSLDEFQWLSLPMAKASLQAVNEAGKLDLTNPAFVKAAEWYSGLVTGLKVSSAPPSASESGWDPGQFENGKAAMIIDGTWNATRYTGKDMPFTGGTVRLPAGPAGPFGVALGSGYGIAANCANKQAALKVLGALAGPKTEAVIAKQGGYPAQIGSQQLFYDALPAETKDGLTAAFKAAFDGASTQRVTPEWEQITTAFPQELVSVYTGQKPMADALGGLQQRFAK
ncbi:ABC transporter substrate-binding protein [Nonomuraea sp. CA-143628]|uniref:ABC transporter substrate-binding protein n=1 Tax=Nonomuraea sp. CA-143628 TaxID=3239997 RepID=UPI003D90BD07